MAVQRRAQSQARNEEKGVGVVMWDRESEMYRKYGSVPAFPEVKSAVETRNPE
jgi:hypothetical protein